MNKAEVEVKVERSLTFFICISQHLILASVLA